MVFQVKLFHIIKMSNEKLHSKLIDIYNKVTTILDKHKVRNKHRDGTTTSKYKFTSILFQPLNESSNFKIILKKLKQVKETKKKNRNML